VRVKVHSGRITFSNDHDRARINAGERLTIYSRADRLDRVSAFNTYDRDGFDSYCERALEIRRGASWDRVPPRSATTAMTWTSMATGWR
jgi:hypothetical protein